MIICIIIGVISIFLGVWISAYADYVRHFLSGMCLAFYGALLTLYSLYCIATPIPTTYYLEAEPLAYNYETNLTYFTSAEGQFKAEGIYPENTYLLTMDNNGTSDKKDDIVLVVWEPSEGEVG